MGEVVNKTGAHTAFQSFDGPTCAKPKNLFGEGGAGCSRKKAHKDLRVFCTVDVRETAENYRECSAVTEAIRGRSRWPRCPKVISLAFYCVMTECPRPKASQKVPTLFLTVRVDEASRSDVADLGGGDR